MWCLKTRRKDSTRENSQSFSVGPTLPRRLRPTESHPNMGRHCILVRINGEHKANAIMDYGQVTVPGLENTGSGWCSGKRLAELTSHKFCLEFLTMYYKDTYNILKSPANLYLILNPSLSSSETIIRSVLVHWWSAGAYFTPEALAMHWQIMYTAVSVLKN